MAAKRTAIVAPFLAPGDLVSVVAPSGIVDRKRLAAGVAYLEGQGHPVHVSSHALDRHGYLAGDDRTRADAFNEVVSRGEAKAILMARGGYGLTRILDRLDLDLLRRRPRLLLGFSDATALFMALQRRGPYLAWYGPMVSEMGDRSAFNQKSLWSALYGRPDAFRVSFGRGQVLRAGRATGRVLGGCLSLLVSLLGTPHDPDYRGAILFWEDIGEEPYRVDRMLTQLRNAGKLDHLAGMVIGSLTGCTPAGGRPSLTIRRILQEVAAGARFPIVWRVKAGHVGRRITLPLGLPATLDTARGGLVYRVPPGAGAGSPQ